MEARTLDRLVDVQQPVITRDATTGAQLITWQVFAANVWASREDSTSAVGEESLRDSVQVHGQVSRMRIRWLPGLNATMRLDLGGGRLRQIVGMAELGRQEGWELTTREWSHQGAGA